MARSTAITFMVSASAGDGDRTDLPHPARPVDLRRFVQRGVTIDDGARAERRVTTLMGDKVEPRRKWIEANVDFGMEEDTTSLS